MDKALVLAQAEAFAQAYFKTDQSGHDWWHTWRVRNLALYIAQREGGDVFIIEPAALLHDVGDWKFNNNTPNSSQLTTWLRDHGVTPSLIQDICTIVERLSFKGAGVDASMNTLEGKIVQDADRLDAMGAIGIARAFTYGAYKKRAIHTPDELPHLHATFEEYIQKESSTVNHFYEKLLLLQDRLNTDTAKQIGKERHAVMQQFIEHFHTEWNLR